MGSSAEKTWAAILKDVHDMVQHAGAAEVSAADAFAVAVKMAAMHAQLEQLAQQPAYPRVAWKKLVLDQEVRGEVVNADHQLQDTSPAMSHAVTHAIIAIVNDCQGHVCCINATLPPCLAPCSLQTHTGTPQAEHLLHRKLPADQVTSFL